MSTDKLGTEIEAINTKIQSNDAKITAIETENKKLKGQIDKLTPAETEAAKEANVLNVTAEGLTQTGKVVTYTTWGGVDLTGYLGQFVAAGKFNDSGNLSWANVGAAPEIATKSVRDLELGAALALAKDMDGDIDGSSSTGTSSVKEGEEKFVFGASYSGLQGVGISETSGLSANYVRGKRVSWLAGDQWSYHEGGSAFSESNVDEMSSITKAKGAVISETNADSVRSMSYAHRENFSFRVGGGIIASINVGATTTEVVAAGVSVNAYLNAAAKVTCNVSAVSSNFSLHGKLIDIKYFGSLKIDKTFGKVAISEVDTLVNTIINTGQTIESFVDVVQTLGTLAKRIKSSTENIEAQVVAVARAASNYVQHVENVDSGVLEANNRVEEINTSKLFTNNEISKKVNSLKNIKSEISQGGAHVSQQDINISN